MLARALTGWGFAAPATVLVVGLSIFPSLWAFFISRTKWNGITDPKNIGFTNYQNMARDPDLAAAIWHTLLFTVLFVPTSILLGIVLAIALNRPIRFITFYRTCIFVPFVASAAATGMPRELCFQPAVRRSERPVASTSPAATAVPREQ